jgi:hypothetical protein
VKRWRTTQYYLYRHSVFAQDFFRKSCAQYSELIPPGLQVLAALICQPPDQSLPELVGSANGGSLTPDDPG